jgi:hypothetical protein
MNPFKCFSALVLGSFLLVASTEIANANTCSQTMGPYWSQYEAEWVAQQARSQGYETSNIWHSDGVYSDSSNTKYYFNVFYAC